MENSILPHRMFIYGTLKSGQPNHFHFEKNKHGMSRFVSCAVTEHAFPLVISSKWNLPFLLYSPGNGQQILGEIYDVDGKLLDWLDEFEGHPDMYVREKVKVDLLSDDTGSEKLGQTECWVYFFKRFPPEMLQLETYASYDAYGSHNKVYVAEEDLSTAENIDEAVEFKS